MVTIVATWSEGGARTDAAFQAMREHFRRRRMTEGPSPALTQLENNAIVTELIAWLERHGQFVAKSRSEKRAERALEAAAQHENQEGSLPTPRSQGPT